MFNKQVTVVWLMVVSLGVLGCSSEAYTDGSADVRGDWLVDFGADNQGVLRLQEGEIWAICYGPDAKLGGYTVKQGWLTMTLDFMDGQGDHLFVGEVVDQTEAGFRVALAATSPGSSMKFGRYSGDCSEVTGG